MQPTLFDALFDAPAPAPAKDDLAARIRVVSKRKDGLAAKPDETVIDVDRTNPVLGNPYILHNQHDLQQRLRVIAAYERDLDRDLAEDGPKAQAIRTIAERLRAGEKIALRCWCAERPSRGARDGFAIDAERSREARDGEAIDVERPGRGARDGEAIDARPPGKPQRPCHGDRIRLEVLRFAANPT